MRVVAARMLVAGALLACAAPALAGDPPPQQTPPPCPTDAPPPPGSNCPPTEPCPTDPQTVCHPDPILPSREVLSEPGELSRWAFVVRKTIARREPRQGSRAVARVHLKTQDGTDELVLALERTTDDQGRQWIRIRLPILPNS